MTRSGDVFEFGEFRLDLRRMGVWRGGEPVPLEPKSLDVLCYLIARRDRLVTKDELLDHVWKDTFVTPNALTRSIAQLRKALGDDPEHPTFIETVSKRGYRFIAPVVEIDTGEIRDPRSASSGNLDSQASIRPNEPVAERTASAADAARPRAAPEPVAWLRVAKVIVSIVGFALVIATVWYGLRTPHVPAAPTVTPLTSMGDVIDAAISPDGRYLAFVRSAGGLQSLWVRQLRGTNPIELVPAAPVGYFGIAFAPDSQSIYYVVRAPAPLASPGGMLFRIPTLGGAPHRLGTSVETQVAVSPDGTRLASLRSNYPKVGESSLVVGNADGTGIRPVLTVKAPESVAPGFFIAPSWSPRGDRLAVAVRNAERFEARLVTVDVASGTTHDFPHRFTHATSVAWLPDDSGIVLVADERGASVEAASTQLWWQPLPDGEPQPLTAGSLQYRNISASADARSLVAVGTTYLGAIWEVPLDGRAAAKIPSLGTDGGSGLAGLGDDRIVFQSLDGGTPQIWTMNRDGSQRRQLTTEGNNLWPRPTRDGRTIFFASHRGVGMELWRMNADGTAPARLLRMTDIGNLQLSPDETVLFFESPAAGTDSTWRVSVDGGKPVLIVNGLRTASVSPDGRRLAGIWSDSPSRAPALAVFDATGGLPLQTFEGPFGATNTNVWWSADGRSLLYTSAERMNVWRQPLAGGPPERLTHFVDGSIIRGDLSPDGRRLLAFRGTVSRDAYLVTRGRGDSGS